MRKSAPRISRVLTVLMMATMAGATHAQTVGENIALGKPVTFLGGRVPNYWLCSDANDAAQLTDGVFMEHTPTKAMWEYSGCVGWYSARPIISVDLGAIVPIAQVSFDTAARQPDIGWPKKIEIAVSDDGQNWRYIGDLVATATPAAPPVSGTPKFNFTSSNLNAKARYVAFAPLSDNFIFVDEIAVTRGADDGNFVSGTPISTDLPTYIDERFLASLARRRLNADLQTVRAELPKVADVSTRNSISSQLDALQNQTNALGTFPKASTTILPLNDIHRNIFVQYGRALAAQSYFHTVVWRRPRYQKTPLVAVPEKNQRVDLEINLLKGQRRADAMLMTNASASPKTVTLELDSTPTGAQSGWLQVASVEWTDTLDGVPVADALMPVPLVNGGYSITIPAGMTRKVWFTIDGTKLPAGQFNCRARVMENGLNTVLFWLTGRVYNRTMPRPRYSLGLWDYSDNNGFQALGAGNRTASIAAMRAAHVDTPWASAAALPMPTAQDFNADGTLNKSLDFTAFDQWISMWPNARNYFVFANLSDTFAGATLGTPEYSQRLGAWAKALSAHMTQKGLQPKQLGLLLNDEPRTTQQDLLIAEQARIINAVAPELTLFSNPIWPRPDQSNQDAQTRMDILCPQLPIYKNGGEPVRQHFENLRQSGKKLWVFQCTGPTRPYSPQLYYRYQAWHAFKMGAVGSGFWAFGDVGGAPNSWRGYLAAGPNFEPAFLDDTSFTSSLHWEAMREGVEDYEELAMLRDAIGRTSNTTLKAQAQQTLDNAINAITAIWSENYAWDNDANAALADSELQKVRAMLVQLPA